MLIQVHAYCLVMHVIIRNEKIESNFHNKYLPSLKTNSQPSTQLSLNGYISGRPEIIQARAGHVYIQRTTQKCCISKNDSLSMLSTQLVTSIEWKYDKG